MCNTTSSFSSTAGVVGSAGISTVLISILGEAISIFSISFFSVFGLTTSTILFVGFSVVDAFLVGFLFKSILPKMIGPSNSGASIFTFSVGFDTSFFLVFSTGTSPSSVDVESVVFSSFFLVVFLGLGSKSILPKILGPSNSGGATCFIFSTSSCAFFDSFSFSSCAFFSSSFALFKTTFSLFFFAARSASNSLMSASYMSPDKTGSGLLSTEKPVLFKKSTIVDLPTLNSFAAFIRRIVFAVSDIFKFSLVHGW